MFVNEIVESLNDYVLRLCTDTTEVLDLIDSADIKCQHPGKPKVPDEMLQLLQPASVPFAKLKVQLGCSLIVIPTCKIKQGQCNDTLIILTGI